MRTQPLISRLGALRAGLAGAARRSRARRPRGNVVRSALDRRSQVVRSRLEQGSPPSGKARAGVAAWGPVLVSTLLALGGLTSLFLAWVSTRLAPIMIERTVIALNQGLPFESVLPTVHRLLADGRIQPVPGWAIAAEIVLGAVLIYLAAFVWFNRGRGGVGLRDLLTLRYWSEFRLGLYYPRLARRS